MDKQWASQYSDFKMKMSASLKSMISSNVDLRHFVSSEDVFHIPIEMEIGPKNDEGAEIFQAEICSPKWLEVHRNFVFELPEGVKVAWVTRPFLVANKFIYDDICCFLNEFLSGIEGQSWQELAENINKYFLWEFDAYSGS